jgi:hypothetical protein
MAVTWITEQDVLDFLGIAPTSEEDAAFVATVTAAANDWCYRRRREAGYVDEEDEVPSDAVFAGTQLFAGMMYRERGSVDAYSTYDGMGVVQTGGGLARVFQLLGVNRPQIA